MKSIRIRGGIICDGTGRPSFPGELLLCNGMIEEVGTTVSSSRFVEEINADGLLICPGFVDAHAHSDLSLFAAPQAYGKISQGITSEISGNCGLSAFPVQTDEVRVHLNALYRTYGVKISWNDFAGFAQALEARKPSINAGFLCGQNTLRANILGYADTPNTPDDWESMRRLLSEMLEQGALGFSTGLLYIPGKFSSREELLHVASALKPFNMPYATHLRSEGNGLLEAIEEALDIAKAGSGHLHISHLKTAQPANWKKLDAVFARLKEARTTGMRITGDRYPYVYAQTSLSVILPPPYDSMTDSAIESALRTNPSQIPDLINALNLQNHRWDRILLCSTNLPDVKPWLGKSLLWISERINCPPAELCAALLTSDGGTLAAFGGMSEENMMRIIDESWICCGTDETARPLEYDFGRSHPRGFGSFARFIGYERNLRPLEEIIHRLSLFPAEIFGLSNRGSLEAGKAADILFLDWNSLHDCADFEFPHKISQGVKRVYVNGILSYENGVVCGDAGQILKKNRKK